MHLSAVRSIKGLVHPQQTGRNRSSSVGDPTALQAAGAGPTKVTGVATHFVAIEKPSTEPAGTAELLTVLAIREGEKARTRRWGPGLVTNHRPSHGAVVRPSNGRMMGSFAEKVLSKVRV